jgi:hypothetical protein
VTTADDTGTLFMGLISVIENPEAVAQSLSHSTPLQKV